MKPTDLLEQELQMKAAAIVPAAHRLGRDRGRLSMTSLLRDLGTPYGIGRRVIEQMECAGAVRRDGVEWAYLEGGRK